MYMTGVQDLLWDSSLDFSNRPEIWQAPRQQRGRYAWQIAEQYDNYNIQRGFETSWDLVVRLRPLREQRPWGGGY